MALIAADGWSPHALEIPCQAARPPKAETAAMPQRPPSETSWVSATAARSASRTMLATPQSAMK